MRGDRRIKAVEIDGYTALNAYVPPKERRGVVLVDPPYEQPDEFDRLAEALANAHRKWPTGIYLVWYPIKDERAQAFARQHRPVSASRASCCAELDAWRRAIRAASAAAGCDRQPALDAGGRARKPCCPRSPPPSPAMPGRARTSWLTGEK